MFGTYARNFIAGQGRYQPERKVEMDDSIKEVDKDSLTPGDKVKCRAAFQKLNVVRMDLQVVEVGNEVPNSDDFKEKDRSFICVLDIDDNPSMDGEIVKKLTGAKTLNLWYQVHLEGFDIVDSMEAVRSLEQMLATWPASEGGQA